jgi:diguanylate cyclase (GGDEF)-like protein/PAS domain S-box-containing protein
MFQRLRSFNQTTTMLGLLTIVALWTGVFLLAHQERERASQNAVKRGGALARVFEEYISRTIKGTDSQLLLLRNFYEQNPEHFDFANWADRNKILSDLTIQFSVVGPDGVIKLSSLGPIQSRIDISQIESFSVHANSAGDKLYISAPVLGHISGKWSLQLTRRLTAADGSFGGTIGASIDVHQLETFYNSVDVGPDGVITLLGYDGIIRARSGRDTAAKQFIGGSVIKSKALGLLRQAPAGSFWTDAERAGQFDGVIRLISYRAAGGLPLIAIVGLSEDDIFQQALSTASQYRQIGSLLTIIVLLAMAVGARRQAQLSSAATSMERMNRRFDATLESLPQGLCVFDCENRLVICNRRYSEMYGLTPDQITPGTSLHDILAIRSAAGNAPREGIQHVEDRLRNGTQSTSGYFDYELCDGRNVAVSREPFPEGGWLAIHQDITTQKKAEKQIVYLARHDALTGIANRAVLQERMEEASSRLRRQGDAFAILLLDLDGFKYINDTLGHAGGDGLLKQLAHRLKSSVRETEIVARLGGDEFAIIQSGEPNPREAAIGLAVRLLELVAQPFDLDGHNVTVGTSIGIALAPEDGVDPGELLKKADLALYRVKSEGKNNFRLFHTEMSGHAAARVLLIHDMRGALTRDEFELHYQPVIDVKTCRPCAVEALVRWRHPIEGLILPDRFIGLAEETGLMEPLGEWILERACTDATSWPDNIKVAVNLSAVQFRSGKLFDVILCALVETGLSPERLELEITESVLMQNKENSGVVIEQLKNIGVSIVLDDFGTGYSSLSYLTMFPFDKIKIDKSFTQGLTSRAACAAVVASVLTLSRGLDMTVTAEGVETKQQFELLRAAGVNRVQGYFFGRPTPFAELHFATLKSTGSIDTAA